MAKAKEATAEKEQTSAPAPETSQGELVKQPAAGLPMVAGMSMADLLADRGKGSQNVEATDMSTPIIAILQSNSPQVQRSNPKHISGAVEGMLHNNVTNEVYSGEEGLDIVPCFFEKVFIEWKPKRGGLVGIHDVNTPLRNQVKMVRGDDDKVRPILPSGNVLAETNQHYVLILKPNGTWEPAVIAMSSSAMKASRLWNTLINRVVLADEKGVAFSPASYYMHYRLKTIARQKDTYSWFGWTVEAIAPVPSREIYEAARAFESSVSKGLVRVKQEQVDEDTPAAAASAPTAGAAADDEIPF